MSTPIKPRPAHKPPTPALSNSKSIALLAPSRSLATTLQQAQSHPESLTPHAVMQLQRVLGNRAVSTLLQRTTTAPAIIQRNAFLTRCAQISTHTPTQIDYAQVANAGANYLTDLGKLHFGIVALVRKTLRRQATLQALEDENITNEVNAYANTHLGGYMGGFISTNTDIRSSHSGGKIDTLLPQDAYDPARPVGAAGGVGAVLPGKPAAANAGVRGPANWAWMEASTEKHTTHPDAGVLHHVNDLNRVASYFEYHFDTITDTVTKEKLLSGGRVVFDPFNHQFFVSEHYAAEYELINVPAVIAHPAYNGVRQNIQNFRNLHAPMGGPNPVQWDQKIGQVMTAIEQGTL